MPKTLAVEPTKEHKALAREFYLENSAMNKAKKASEAARQKLFQGLEAAGLEEFTFDTTDYDGKKLRLTTTVKAPDLVEIDVEKLRALVEPEVFLKLVTTSQKAIETHAGKSTLQLVTKTILGGGTKNVGVKPASA